MPIDAARVTVPASRKRLFGDAATAALANVASTALSAIAGLVLARTLDVNQFGVATSGVNAYLLISLIGGLGLTTGATFAAASAPRGGTVSPALAMLGTVRIATALLIAASGAATAVAMSDAVPAVVAAAAAASLVQDFLAGILLGIGQPRGAAIIAVAQPLVYATGLLFLAPGHGRGAVEIFSAAFALSLPLAVSLVARCAAIPRLGWGGAGALRGALSVSAYSFILTFFQLGFLSAAVAALGALGQTAAAAGLSVVFTLLRLVPTIWASVIAFALYPRLAQLGAAAVPDTNTHTNPTNPPRTLPAGFASLLSAFAALSASLAIPAAAALLVASQPLLHWLFAGRYDAVSPVVSAAAVLVPALMLEATLTSAQLAWGAGRVAIVLLGARITLATSAVPVFAAVPGAADNPTTLVAAVVWAHVAGAILAVIGQVVWGLRAGALRWTRGTP